ncbi:fumarylacetoacetate hydrolase family protein [Herbiconiux liukaitaii]|uniref:fumarylacetoacetate hydrolase family protein n=1 Tax=Herbiconiux liukaitaii TaxID=3342799 RepID=UPI0035B85823
MAWVSYRHGGMDHVGIVDGEHYTPLVGITHIGPGAGEQELLAASRDEEGRVLASEVELLPVSPAAGKVFCVGLNYNDHVVETKRELPTYPVLFPKYASSLIAADKPILAPSESHQIDYEGELAVIIGSAGRRIAREDAMAHVLGYAVSNDVTMRDYQYKTHQWMQGKAWDGSTPIGPTIVPRDEVDLTATGIRTIVDGETVQDSDLTKLIFDIPTLVSTISEFTELQPGDVILSGTPGGVGFRRDPQLFLVPGSKVSVEIDGVGRIDSVVVAEPRE